MSYSAALNSLNRYIISSIGVEQQYELLNHSVNVIESLAVDAQLTESCSCIFGTRTAFLCRFRHPIEVLKKIDPDLASEFGTFNCQLDRFALSLKNASAVN